MSEKKQVKIEYFEEIASTNDYAKEKRLLGEDLIVIAKRQTGGRGTKGRSFSSQTGGVYLTKLTFYKNLSAKESFRIMSGAAVAVCKTLESFGISPVIKWPNDIFVNGRKICGILIENTFAGANIANSVVGIGVNVCNSLPEELKDIATSMTLLTGREFSVSEVTQKLIAQLLEETDMEEYCSRIGYLGKCVHLLIGDERIPATLLSVDEQGGLWAEINGERKRFTSAEVSVRV